MGTTDNGQSIEIRESTRVPPGETQLVRLSIGELEAGSYRFEARGISPLSFIESTELQYKHKVRRNNSFDVTSQHISCFAGILGVHPD